MTFRLSFNTSGYPKAQIGDSKETMPLEDFIETAQTIRSLELEYNEIGANSPLGELLQKSKNPAYEISDVVDRGPEGQLLWYSNRKLLKNLKLIDDKGKLNKFVYLILSKGSKIDSSHVDGNKRIVISYKELSSPYNEGEKRFFLSPEERYGFPRLSWVVLQGDSQERRSQLLNVLGKHQRNE